MHRRPVGGTEGYALNPKFRAASAGPRSEIDANPSSPVPTFSTDIFSNAMQKRQNAGIYVRWCFDATSPASASLRPSPRGGRFHFRPAGPWLLRPCPSSRATYWLKLKASFRSRIAGSKVIPHPARFSDCRSRWRRTSNEMDRMAESGTLTFASPDDYRAAITAGTVNLIVTGGGSFNARLTWLNLGHLHVFRGRENLPRIGFFSLSPAQTFVSFPTKAGAPLTYGGIGLRFGDLVLHSRGERMHQRIDGE